MHRKSGQNQFVEEYFDNWHRSSVTTCVFTWYRYHDYVQCSLNYGSKRAMDRILVGPHRTTELICFHKPGSYNETKRHFWILVWWRFRAQDYVNATSSIARLPPLPKCSVIPEQVCCWFSTKMIQKIVKIRPRSNSMEMELITFQIELFLCLSYHWIGKEGHTGQRIG